MTQSVLRLGNVGDGQFLATVDEKFREIQEKLCRHWQKHEKVGAKAVLTVKVTLAMEPSKVPSIQAEIETKTPGDPPYQGIGQFSFDEHGPCIKVNHSFDYSDPRQKRLFTPDGRAVDPTTGEIKDSGDQNPKPQPPEGPPLPQD